MLRSLVNGVLSSRGGATRGTGTRGGYGGGMSRGTGGMGGTRGAGVGSAVGLASRFLRRR